MGCCVASACFAQSTQFHPFRFGIGAFALAELNNLLTRRGWQIIDLDVRVLIVPKAFKPLHVCLDEGSKRRFPAPEKLDRFVIACALNTFVIRAIEGKLIARGVGKNPKFVVKIAAGQFVHGQG